MSSPPKVIGEGSYGCIHKPNLICSDNSKYNKPIPDKISKLLTQKYAKIEMGEYSNIHKADPSKKYYLGNPVKCKVSTVQTNLKAIQKCEKNKTIKDNLADYALLIMDYGGLSLRQLAPVMEKMKRTTSNVRKAELFWLEVHRLFKGVHVFLKNGIIHNDLKPHNIVYDSKKNRLNFIDFGLMKTMSTTKSDIEEDHYSFAKFHWSLPLEMPFLSKTVYNDFMQKPSSEKEEYFKYFLQSLETNKTEVADKVNFFFSYIFTESESDQLIKREFMQKYIQELRELPISFDKWNTNQTLKTIDIYGLGLSLLYMLNSSAHLLNPNMVHDMRFIFLKMVSPNVSERSNIDNLMQEYELLLQNHGLLKKYKIHFKNHKYECGISKIKSKKHSVDHSLNTIDFAKSIMSKTQFNEKDRHHNKIMSNKTMKNRRLL